MGNNFEYEVYLKNGEKVETKYPIMKYTILDKFELMEFYSVYRKKECFVLSVPLSNVGYIRLVDRNEKDN